MPKDKMTWKEERLLLLIGCIACSLAAGYIFLFLNREATDLLPGDLKPVPGLVLAAEPEFRSNKGKENVAFLFRGHNKEFLVSGYDSNPDARAAIRAGLHTGDTVDILVTPEEYAELGEDGFFEGTINLVGLRHNGQDFLSLERRNDQAFRGNRGALPAFIYAAVMCFIFWNMPHRPKRVSPTLVISLGALLVLFISIRFF
ncbi:hypothetical protein [Flaviaesturariibacter amylovorans]|uniref:DUF3592 domain-containing protein n=1 Tax=Flaviaesturariibacter amylovorans TaxID=1084520 RepID=A0ABP8HBP2_9BACT